MADIYPRLLKAVKQAEVNFLKEVLTVKLAIFVRDALPIIEAEIHITSPEHGLQLEESLHRNRSLTHYVTAALSGSNASEIPGFNARLKRALKVRDPLLLKSLCRLEEHFQQAQVVIDLAQLPQATEKDRIRASRVAQHLTGMVEQSVERAERMKHKIMQEIETGQTATPEVLVLSGGGAQGPAYLGVARTLEDKGWLKKIKYVSGNSAGGAAALLISFGYPIDEAENITLEARFAQFFTESSGIFKNLIKIKEVFGPTEPKDAPYYEGDLFDEFASKHFLPLLEELSGRTLKSWINLGEDECQYRLRILEQGVDRRSRSSLEQIFNEAWFKYGEELKAVGRGQDLEILHFPQLFGRSEAMSCALSCIRLARPESLPDSDTIEAFFGDVIQHRLKEVPVEVLRSLNPPIHTLYDQRNIDFEQLKQLTVLCPHMGFKELGLAITDSYLPTSPSNALRYIKRTWERYANKLQGKEREDTGVGLFDTNTAFKPIFARAGGDGQYLNMPIKKAVRASMNIPVVFSPIKHGSMKLVDGLITNNYPARIFSDCYADQDEANRNTIGFMFSGVETDIEVRAISQMVKKGGYMDILFEHEEPSASDKLKAITLILKHPLTMAKKLITRAAEKVVDRIMESNNLYLPSLEAMENVGIINTAFVTPGDFHLDRMAKLRLMQAGSQAVMSLTNIDADMRLRFAMGQLLSLSRIEASLVRERGLAPRHDAPVFRIQDAASLACLLENPRYDQWSLGEILYGEPLPRKPRAEYKDRESNSHEPI